MAYFCPNCGTQNGDTDKFCLNCGTKLHEDQPAVDPVAQVNEAASVEAQELAAAVTQNAAASAAGEGLGEFVQPAQQSQQYSTADFVYQDNKGSGEAAAKKKGSLTTMVIAGIAIVAFIIGLVVFKLLTAYTKIDAKELFDIEFAGPNGHGVCYAQLDIDPYFAASEYNVEMEDYSITKCGEKNDEDNEIEYSNYFSDERKDLEKAYPKAKDKDEMKDMRDALLRTDKKENTFKLVATPSQQTGLSNGDKVTIDIEFDEEYLKENKIKLENTSFELEVKGLEDATEIDPFEGLELKFTGIDTEGRLDYDSLNNKKFDFIYYNAVTSSYDLKNGDEFEVSAEVDTYYFSGGVNYLDEDDHNKGFWFRYDDKVYVWPFSGTTASKKFKVSGLTALEEVDPMNEIEIEYSGADPFLDVDVNVKADSKFRDNIYARVEDEYNDRYKIGDNVTVKVSAHYGLKESGYKLKGADSEDTVSLEITVGDDAPKYIRVEDAPAAMRDETIAEKYKNAEAKIKQDLQGTKYYKNITLDAKCDSVSSIKSAVTYHLFNDITDYASLGYGASVNGIARVFKVELKLDGGGKQTVFVVASLSNIIKNADGTFTTDSDIKFEAYTDKNEATDSIKKREGFTVTSFRMDSDAKKADENTSSAEETSSADVSAAEDSSAAESTTDESAAESAADSAAEDASSAQETEESSAASDAA